MSVANTAVIAAEDGNGIKVAFDFTFKIFANTDLVVYKETAAGVYTLQTLGVDYTVSFDTDDETGTVTYTTAPGSALESVIIRDTTEDQGTNFPREKPLPEQQVADALDKLTLIVQEHTELLNRVPALPIVPPNPAGSEIKDRIASRALKWSFNASSGKWEIVSSSQDPDDVTGTAVLSGLASARPASPTNSILHWYNTDTGQVDLWILAANQWFDAIA